jgi:hypothetical protein
MASLLFLNRQPQKDWLNTYAAGAGAAGNGLLSRRRLVYFDFFSSLAFLFSLMDFAGFFFTSFLMSLDFAITDLLCELVYANEYDSGSSAKALLNDAMIQTAASPPCTEPRALATG